MPASQRSNLQKRFSCIAGKAAPQYHRAKSIIKLINTVADVINADPDVSPYLKFAFLPDYGVTMAQLLIPAADTSQHLATAGIAASGTSIMKFAMNGGLIMGTWDGANEELCREVGGELNHFIFGARDEEISGIRSEASNGHYPIDARLANVFDALRQGQFSDGDHEFTKELCGIIDQLCHTRAAGTHEGDKYLLCHDFPSYAEAQERLDQEYKSRVLFVARSIETAGCAGWFSADRSVMDYAERIWKLPRCACPMAAKPTG